MKRVIVSFIALISVLNIMACTSAIISGNLTHNGKPMMWKHRDTGDENNLLVHFDAKDGKYEFVGLVNGDDIQNKEVWTGYNAKGFAIMNTASYNLKDDNVKLQDQEGVLMKEALGVCVTVDDFEQFLTSYAKPLGVEANFGVIDAQGNGAYFETNNHSFKRFDVKDEPEGYIIRTNYSVSGRENEGYGYIRYETAKKLIDEANSGHMIMPTIFTEGISRSFYHSLLDINASDLKSEWAIDQDFIPRRISTASIVIEGVTPGENPIFTTMWIAIGYPPCSVTLPVWLTENGIPQILQANENHRSPLCNEVVALKHQIFSIIRGSGKSYLNIGKLYNEEGTGISQQLIDISIDNETEARSYLNTSRERGFFIPEETKATIDNCKGIELK